MKQVDLSLVVTAHAETLEAGPAFKSAEAALALVEAAGFSTERLIGLDNHTPQTERFLAQPALSEWQQNVFSFADQGKTRNGLIEKAKGRFVAILDADDLFSENWLVEAVGFLDRQPPEAKIIAHPELIWQFDGSNTVYTQPSQSSPMFTPHHLAIQNYYDALCVAPKAVWNEVKYSDRDVASGYAYEDWLWAIETISAGWTHMAVQDTLIFKRRRDSSQSQQARLRRVTVRPVNALAIDQIQSLKS